MGPTVSQERDRWLTLGSNVHLVFFGAIRVVVI
jgi:hypothetical protein